MMPLGPIFRLVWRVSAFGIGTAAYWCLFEFDALRSGRDRRQEVIHRWVPRWSRRMLRLFGVSAELHGPHVEQGKLYPGHDQNDVGRVFVANHRSAYDIPVLFLVAQAHVISRHDLASWPLLGRSARRIGTLFVDRTSRRSGASVLKEVDEALARGEGVAMFPEGTAHEGDEVREFRPGAINAARRSGGEIVPIGIAYGHEDAYFYKESFLVHVKRIAKLRALRVAVEMGQPVRIGDRSTIETKEQLRLEVQQLVDHARERLNSESPASRIKM